MYTASTQEVRVRRGAGRVRRRLGARDWLARDAAAVGLSVPEFLQAVDEDWAELGVMFPGHLPRAWRTARLLYTVTHPRPGWWVMLDTAESDRHGQGRAAGHRPCTNPIEGAAPVSVQATSGARG